ncbi:MAG: DUF421 domain-containing protein [Bacilli bacterium]|nr:DUF421 domain-containing protein [Bacilli bacterium]MDD4808659.1 DUF421 domain-containing protein [Bacilli bacterium]
MDFNFTEIWDILFRGIIALATLFLVTKLVGKKQISELSLFDYVIGISIGNFAAEMTINIESQYINGVVALLLFGLMSYLISFLTIKSIMLRRFFMGVPTIVIEEGKIMTNNLKKIKFDINDLLEVARLSGYFNISDIEYAVMETSGEISFLPKGKKLPVTIEDMKLKEKKQGLCSNVIIDGKIMTENLKNINKDEKWLSRELKLKGYKLENVILGIVDINNKLTIFEKSVVGPSNVLE